MIILLKIQSCGKYFQAVSGKTIEDYQKKGFVVPLA